MRAERMPWDSAFFGFAVERICVLLAWDGRVEDVLDAIRRSSARVIYVFVPVSNVRHDAVAEALSDVSGVRQGERVLFLKDVAQMAPAEPAVRSARQLTAPIMELALCFRTTSRPKGRFRFLCAAESAGLVFWPSDPIAGEGAWR